MWYNYRVNSPQRLGCYQRVTLLCFTRSSKLFHFTVAALGVRPSRLLDGDIDKDKDRDREADKERQKNKFYILAYIFQMNE